MIIVMIIEKGDYKFITDWGAAKKSDGQNDKFLS